MIKFAQITCNVFSRFYSNCGCFLRATLNQWFLIETWFYRCNEHIAVYLIKGKIAFSVMFGAERSRMKSSERYTDGDWHQLTFERKRNASQLMVDGSIVGQGAINSDSRFFPSNVPFYVGGLHVRRLLFLIFISGFYFLFYFLFLFLSLLFLALIRVHDFGKKMFATF